MLEHRSRYFERLAVPIAIVLYSILVLYFIDAIELGKIKTVGSLLLIPVFIFALVLLNNMSWRPVIFFLLLIYWLPIYVPVLNELYLFEFSLYYLLGIALINQVIGGSRKNLLRLRGFPFWPFMIYVCGALFTYIISYKSGNELTKIRILCVFPMILCIFSFYATKSIKDAQRFIWIIFLSGTILSILFSFGEKYISFVQISTYGETSGRLSMVLNIPYMAPLQILMASAGTYFGMMLIIGYYLLISSVRNTRRLVVLTCCAFLIFAIINGQGRGGAAAAILAIILMTFLYYNKGIRINHGIVLKGLLIITILLFGGLWYSAQKSLNVDYTQRITGLIHDPFSDESLISRKDKWKEGLLTLLERPLGVGMYGFQSSDSGDSWEVHNLYLYLWLSFGPLSLIGYLWILKRIHKKYILGMKSHLDSVKLLSILGVGYLFFVCVDGMVSALVWEPFSEVIMWMPLGIIFAVCVKENPTELVRK